MPRNSFRQQYRAAAAAGSEEEAGTERHIRALWAQDPPAVTVVKQFRGAFGPYVKDSAGRPIRLFDFEVCPLAGELTGAAYKREEADDFVLIYSSIMGENGGAALTAFFARFDPKTFDQDDAPVLWLGCATALSLEIASLGGIRMNSPRWRILHSVPGRFTPETEWKLMDELNAAAVQIAQYVRKSGPAPGGASAEPVAPGLMRRVLELLHLGRRSSHA